MNKLPEAFKQEIRRLFGETVSESFFMAMANDPFTSIRLNPFKPSSVFKEETSVEWCNYAKYLQERPSFIIDPLFHAGAYYVQESSSMFLHHALKQLLTHFTKPIKVLDLCAAPGGKSTLINSLLKKEDLLVSNEIIRSRVDVLDENLMRWGQSNVFISNNDPKDFSALKNYFDIIVVDAPCSGEGLFRKDKKAVDEWSESNVNLCASRQQRILSDIIPALKPGGFLVYSTCTFNEKENEENVSWMISEYGFKSISVDIDKSWPIALSVNHPEVHSYRFLPHLVKGEGLFLACLQKSNDEVVSINKFREQPLTFIQRKNIEEITKWLANADEYDFIEWNKNIHAIPKNQIADLTILAKYLHLKNAGMMMGELLKEKLLPDHHLALSSALSPSINRIDVTKEEAQKYLKKDTLILTQKYEQGIYLITYEGLGLGWVKVLQNRINNYLPTHFRILKDIK